MRVSDHGKDGAHLGAGLVIHSRLGTRLTLSLGPRKSWSDNVNTSDTMGCDQQARTRTGHCVTGVDLVSPGLTPTASAASEHAGPIDASGAREIDQKAAEVIAEDEQAMAKRLRR